MSGCSLILSELQDGQWHSVIQLMMKLKPNSINWAVRSRISELKRKGHNIQSRIGGSGCAEYRLVQTGGFTDNPPAVSKFDRLLSAQVKFEGKQAVMVI